MDTRLHVPSEVLRISLGLMAFLAGADKFLNILADWGHYVSPFAAQLLPVPVPTFMMAVGAIEVGVGILILDAAPRVGAYVASAWLLLVAANLALAGYFDVAVRDVVLSIASFTLARLVEAQTAAAPAEARAGRARIAAA